MRKPGCLFYSGCLSRAALENTGMDCGGCARYQERSGMDAAEMEALHLLAFFVLGILKRDHEGGIVPAYDLAIFGRSLRRA